MSLFCKQFWENVVRTSPQFKLWYSYRPNKGRTKILLSIMEGRTAKFSVTRHAPGAVKCIENRFTISELNLRGTSCKWRRKTFTALFMEILMCTRSFRLSSKIVHLGCKFRIDQDFLTINSPFERTALSPETLYIQGLS